MIFRKELTEIKGKSGGKKLSDIMEENGLKEMIRLGSNENPLGVSEKVKEAIMKISNEVNFYPDALCSDLSFELSKKLRVKENQLVFGNGADELIKLLANALISSGDEAVIHTPTFPLYELSVKLMGGTVKKSLCNEDFDVVCEDMLSLITEKTKIFFLCNPNNPTGMVIPFEKIKKTIEKIPENIVVVIDEAYHEYAEDFSGYQSCIPLIEKRKNICVLRTFSKAYALAGMRVGFMVSDSEFISEFVKVKNPFNVSRPAQASALASLKDVDFITKTLNTNKKAMKIIKDTLEELKIKHSKTSTNFLWIYFGEKADYVAEELLKNGFMVMNGALWQKSGYIRLSTGTLEQTEKLCDTLRKIIKK